MPRHQPLHVTTFARRTGIRYTGSLLVGIILILVLLSVLLTSRRGGALPWRRDLLQVDNIINDGVYNYELGIHVSGAYLRRNATIGNVDSARELSRFLRKVRDVGARHGIVALTVANNANAPFVGNWLCGAALRMPDAMARVVVVVTDQPTYRRMLADWPSVHTALFRTDAALQYNLDRSGEQRYKFLLRRIEMLLSALQCNVDILVFDANTLWLKSPFALLSSSAYANSDIVASPTSRPHEPVADGFMLLRATTRLLDAWRTITANLQALQFHNSSQVAWAAYPASELAYLAQLIARGSDVTAPLSVAILPWDLFPDGTWYLKSQSERDYSGACVVVNNWNVGVKMKIDRVRALGYWYMQREGQRSTCPYVK
ncbi:PREDICTED: uncharacterized protein LOC106810525 [Priapulus caudatus]|uniref:Uncharacterized protein LOC106810525 n=1 Tax=Priapulus caudatus TaxID=37621 RepID=A0ABM1EB20_PRICU|nr:PREDICTED: uncharacterized protein LOC106810525 [Priapulus caudatus]